MTKKLRRTALLLSLAILTTVTPSLSAVTPDSDGAITAVPIIAPLQTDAVTAAALAAAAYLENADFQDCDAYGLAVLYAIGKEPVLAGDAPLLEHAVSLLLCGENPHVEIPNLGARLIAEQNANEQAGAVAPLLKALYWLPSLLPSGLYRTVDADYRLSYLQGGDGGFHAPDEDSVTLTALALPLLVRDIPSGTDYAEHAWAYIVNAADSNGLYEGCTATAAVITAAVTLGRAVPETLRDALLSCQTPEGSFRENAAVEADPLTTARAFAALLALRDGTTVYDNLPACYYADEAEAASPDILRMVSRLGLLRGDDTARFHPANSVTRAEFAQTLMNIKDTGSRNVSLLDVSPTAWYATAVYTAVSGGYLTEGISASNFYPNAPVTRVDVALSLYRLLSLDSERAMRALEDGRLHIPDWDKLPEEARKAVAAVCYEDLMDYQTGFRPDSPLRRDALAEILYNIYT